MGRGSARRRRRERDEEDEYEQRTEMSAQQYQRAQLLKRDVTVDILTLVKHMPNLWQKQREDEQRHTIHMAEHLAGRIVNAVAEIIVANGFAAYAVTAASYSVDKEMTIKLKLPRNALVATALMDGRPEGWVLVQADINDYFGGEPVHPDVVGDLGIPLGSKPAPQPDAQTVTPEMKAALDEAEAQLAKARESEKIRKAAEAGADAVTGELPRRAPNPDQPAEKQDEQPPAPNAEGTDTTQ